MSKALDYTATAAKTAAALPTGAKSARRQLDWRRKISNHVAWGLLVYTGLHIFLTMSALQTKQGSILPYLSLIILVGAIIPACRWLEKKWEVLSDDAAADPALASRFRKHAALVWVAAIGLPCALTALFTALLSIA